MINNIFPTKRGGGGTALDPKRNMIMIFGILVTLKVNSMSVTQDSPDLELMSEIQ